MKNYAYKSTSVNWAKSQTSIVKMLNVRGIYQSRFTNMEDKFAIEFLAPQNKGKPVGVRILTPMTYKGENDKKRQRELNRMHRILFYHLKAKFLAIDSGLTEFMEEFMPHLIITDSRGNSTTLGETLLPQYVKIIEEGKSGDFKLLPEPRND